jgi:vancomycin resistance protein YoaR
MRHDASAMTVLEETLQPLGEQPAEEAAVTPSRRARILPRLVFGFLVGFVLALALAAAAAFAYDGAYDGRVLPGVHAAGVDLSGADRDLATTALTAALARYGDGRVVIRTVAGDITIPYRSFARRVDVAAMVDEAFAAGRSGGPVDRALSMLRLARDGTTLQPRLMLDAGGLSGAIETGLDRFSFPAVDSRVVVDGKRIYATQAITGRFFDVPTAAAMAYQQVSVLDAPSEIVIEAPVVRLAPRNGEIEASVAIAAADRMAKDVAVTFGSDHWTLKAPTVRDWLHYEFRADGTAWPAVDQAAVSASLAKVAKAIKVDAVSAIYLKSTSGPIVGVAPAKDGRQLDVAATSAAIVKVLDGRAAGTAGAPVPAVVAKLAPKLSTADAAKHGPVMSKLGSWKTWFPVSERNFFGANIWLPARIIDGTVLRPGQRFEWWSALGPVTAARGFGPGGFIAGDHTEPTGALGGGMCSSSTTLFNAALRAGLQMGARSNHRYYITRYPLGLDATVSKSAGGGGQTMSFTNDMKNPIVIRSFRYRASGKGWVRYEIWGIPDGRKVSLSRASVANVRKATTKTVLVSTLPRGAREQTEFPSNGMDTSVTRVVRGASGQVLHRDVYQSHYTLWNGRIEVGR